MKRLTCAALLLPLLAAAAVAADDPTRVLGAGQLPKDSRLGRPRTLNDKDFFLTPPATKEAWEARRKEVREQVLVATGLWPLPERTPLKPVIHGKIDRDGYTVEKVFFASYPGHYVCGNLYRPKGKSGKLPGVLCPHGHWANGRFYDAGAAGAQAQIKQGAEKTMAGARYPLQARCAQLARMGCVVFHYDMVGVADSKDIGHRLGFTDADAELRLQSFMGLQTWNSIRALDFLLSLPEVDPKRIGVTGASGGGTQTFMLCAVDDRPAVAFPAVMVSTAMQGGCVCENCSYLRQGTGNVELAALFAPKPLGMSGANDWTIDIEKKGLPELKAVYRLYDAEEKVMAKCFPQFGHNYNQVSREVMYNWFNKHLKLGQPEPVVEKPFEPIPPKELSVYDEQHPHPKDAVGAERLRQYLTEASNRQMAALRPKDAKGLEEYRRVVGTALRVMAHDRLPRPADVEAKEVGERTERDGLVWRRYLIGRKGAGEQIPAFGVMGKEFNGEVVVWVHPEGKGSLFRDGKLVPAARKIIDSQAAIFAPDVFWTGEGQGVVLQVKPDTKKLQAAKVALRDLQQAVETFGQSVGDLHLVAAKGREAKIMEDLNQLKVRAGDGRMVPVSALATFVTRDRLPVNEGFAGFTFGYNRPLLANRVHDILTAVAMVKGNEKTKAVHLVGFGKAGPWVIVARGLCGDAVARTAADCNGFRFERVKEVADEMMLPGALKYGGLAGLAGVAAPGELFVHNHHGTGMGHRLEIYWQAAGKADRLRREADKVPAEEVAAWLVR
ncbi:MAG TPA: alpha/beta hydrolase family protein [Gemmataceae bacterium]|nr:alpha/beta hydrolase family protein [Gemmataceae bacterium]